MNIPIEINHVLEKYFENMESKLPKLLDSYYIYGSTSLGEYNRGISDIDFVAILVHDASEQEVNSLLEIHRSMQKQFPKLILDGIYIIADGSDSFSGNKTLRFNEGEFHGYGKFNNHSIDAFQLKTYGIRIKGKENESLTFDVDWEILLRNMRNNLNTYWVNWLNGCKKTLSRQYLSLFVSLDTLEWGVLGVSRLYYTFKEKDITSKVGAGEYALKNVPQRWHKIIQESLRLRKGNKKSHYISIFKRRKDALDYIDYLIRECNSLFK
ncbi:aminoglycoside adenylyltransferase domain-containing protein [Ornithinibacillus xuwenensis]|uniref:Aminoglycoside adenylyltransferase domain-containing protein n=1 Tax=Ornithinibacillus xuwenensis TaxID=3144668 RepID=A0ABU9XDF1_9BACI